MKKINNNNKFRGNTIYSLNYKFDSVSSAGKLSGTALDLIKKYNELAKEAHNNGDYVQMEVFRQYAEHYRKIVTEINERKNQNKDNAVEQNNSQNQASEPSAEKTAEIQPTENNSVETPENNLVETEAAAPQTMTETEVKKTAEKPRKRRSFTVVDVSAKENAAEAETPDSSAEPDPKPRRRVIHRRTAEKPAETAAENA